VKSQDRTDIQAWIDHPDRLLDAIDAALEAALPSELPLVDLAPDEAGEPYRSIEDGRPRHRIVDILLMRNKSGFSEFACVKFDYCNQKKRHARTIDLVKAMSDGLISAALQLPIPAMTLSVYCVQSLFLDRLCNCDD